MESPRQAPVPGPTFLRLIDRLTGVAVTPPAASVSGRLGEWIDWTRAVALSRALDGPLPPAPDGVEDGDFEGDCRRARAALADAISDAHVAAKGTVAGGFGPHLKRCLDLQRRMQAATGRLRGQLRDRLAAGSRDSARLAEIDAALELALSAREQALLGKVPALLETRFDQLRQASHDDTHASAQADDATTPTWLAQFGRDMRDVLLAELDVRFQPIEGLLAALRTR